MNERLRSVWVSSIIATSRFTDYTGKDLFELVCSALGLWLAAIQAVFKVE